MRGRPAKKVRKANLEAKSEDGETILPSLSPTKEFTFDVEHGGRGKRTRIPTQKAVESELDLSQIIIKNEVPDPSDVSIPITVSEEATVTVTVAPMASPE